MLMVGTFLNWLVVTMAAMRKFSQEMVGTKYVDLICGEFNIYFVQAVQGAEGDDDIDENDNGNGGAETRALGPVQAPVFPGKVQAHAAYPSVVWSSKWHIPCNFFL